MKKSAVVTLKAVADRAGVAVSTTSYVLSGKATDAQIAPATQKKILRAARALGYRPNLAAQTLRRQRSGTIGVLVQSLAASWAEELLVGIDRVIEPAGFRSVLAVGRHDPHREAELLRTLTAGQIEGLLISPTPQCDATRLTALARTIPVAILANTLPAAKLSSFMLDCEHAVGLQLEHLTALGHRRIAFLTTDSDAYQIRWRLDAFRQHMRRLRLPLPSGYVATTTTARPERDCEETRKLMSLPEPPTAIAVVNDLVAYNVLSELERMGLRKQVSVIGINNAAPSSYAMIGLTTVSEPLVEIGETAARWALKRIETPTARLTKELLKGQLFVRTSTFPPRH